MQRYTHVIAFDNSTNVKHYYQFHLIFSNMINNFTNTQHLSMICWTAFLFNSCNVRAVSAGASLFCLSNNVNVTSFTNITLFA